MPKLPLLREDQDALSVLVRRAADHLGILDTFVEKDFWVTELLRAVAPGWVIDGQHVSAVFKGGTSLSRVYRLTERFSEDVDILLVYPDDLSPGPRDQALKGIAERARTHLGLDIDQAVSSSATRGVKRNVSYYYPLHQPCCTRAPAAGDGLAWWTQHAPAGDRHLDGRGVRGQLCTQLQDLAGGPSATLRPNEPPLLLCRPDQPILPLFCCTEIAEPLSFCSSSEPAIQSFCHLRMESNPCETMSCAAS